MKSVAISGGLAQAPNRPGHAWVFLQYLLGFRRLGFDVTFVDAIPDGTSARSAATMRRWLEQCMSQAGLDGAWCLRVGDARYAGLSEDAVRGRLSDSLLFNINGFLRDEDLLTLPRRRVFVDIDPGFIQMWSELGLADVVTGHESFVSVAARLGQPDCAIPTLGLPWIATLPPVVLDQWRMSTPRASGAFTSIATWRGPFAPVDYKGKTYGLRAHEFRRFVALPRMSESPFVLALDIDPADDADRSALVEAGWQLSDPRVVTGDATSYRDFIANSTAEFCVAKSMYVATASGWFSDRSACYLAAGRPVLAQDTGLGAALPVGDGLLIFDSPATAKAGVERLTSDLEWHSQAARRLAEEHLDSDIVLTRLLTRLGQA